MRSRFHRVPGALRSVGSMRVDADLLHLAVLRSKSLSPRFPTVVLDGRPWWAAGMEGAGDQLRRKPHVTVEVGPETAAPNHRPGIAEPPGLGRLSLGPLERDVAPQHLDFSHAGFGLQPPELRENKSLLFWATWFAVIWYNSHDNYLSFVYTTVSPGMIYSYCGL